MLRLIYISTARAPIDRASLGQILRTSRANNAAVGVTGLLVVGGRRFLQALEGPPEAVEATFDRIRLDPRHLAVVVLSRREVDTRQFGEWAMGCQLSQAAGGSGAIAAGVELLIDRIEDADIHAEFEQFALRHAA